MRNIFIVYFIVLFVWVAISLYVVIRFLFLGSGISSSYILWSISKLAHYVRSLIDWSSVET